MLKYIIHNNMQYVVGGLAGVVYAIWLYPHTYGLPRYRKFAQLYQNGFEVKVDSDTLMLTEKVLDRMNLSEKNEGSINFFTAFGQELVTKGSVHTRQGGLIGIPANFKYNTVSDIERRKVVLYNKSVAWESPGGQALAESMVLSKNAKKFALAREAYALQTHHVMIGATFASATFLLSYATGFALNSMLRLKSRTGVGFRLFLYSSIGSLGITSYVLLSDAYQCRRDRKLDTKAGKLGQDVVEGGVEFYDKLMQRNIALRSLMDENGPQKYTIFGNELRTYRMPHLPLSARRDYMKELLMKISKSEQHTEQQEEAKL